MPCLHDTGMGDVTYLKVAGLKRFNMVDKSPSDPFKPKCEPGASYIIGCSGLPKVNSTLLPWQSTYARAVICGARLARIDPAYSLGGYQPCLSINRPTSEHKTLIKDLFQS